MMKGNDGGETTTRPYYSTIRYAKKNANPSSKQNQKFGGSTPQKLHGPSPKQPRARDLVSQPLLQRNLFKAYIF